MNAMTAIQTKKEKGFTLIELVMVIVILGILAAFALPRFADLGGEARASSIQGALGAVRSASSIAHSKALASGATGSITLEGKTITLLNGYPNASGILTAAQLSDEYTVTPASIVENAAVTIGLGTCTFSYTPPATADDAPIISAIAGQVGGSC